MDMRYVKLFGIRAHAFAEATAGKPCRIFLKFLCGGLLIYHRAASPSLLPSLKLRQAKQRHPVNEGKLFRKIGMKHLGRLGLSVGMCASPAKARGLHNPDIVGTSQARLRKPSADKLRVLLHLSIPQARNFVLCFKYFYSRALNFLTMNEFLGIFRETLSLISHSRFFETERGFQGQLNALLVQNLKGIVPNQYVVEEEYQKRFKAHGIKIRPDIIIHAPFEPNTHKDRSEGNFAVIQIKLKASEKDAREDFEKLNLMFEKLNYPLGIFINISSDETHYRNYEGKFVDRLHCFSVELNRTKGVIVSQN